MRNRLSKFKDDESIIENSDEDSKIFEHFQREEEERKLAE